MAEPIEISRKSLIRKSSAADASVLDYGKLPPQAKEMEEAILGAVMIEESAIHEVVEILKSEECFYVDAHQRIWKAIKMLHLMHSKIDLLTVTEQLKKHGDLDAAGGPFFVAQLTNKVGSSAHIEEHARVVFEKYLQRQMIVRATEVIKAAYEDTTDVIQLLDSAVVSFENLNSEMAGQGAVSFADSVVDEADRLHKAFESEQFITGVPTYSEALDKHLLGFQPGNLIIIAGRPGMGKTTIAWHIARQQLKHDIPVGFFSLEMRDRELIRKMFAAEVRVDSLQVRKGGLNKEEWQRLYKKLPELSSYPIELYDRAGITVNQLVAKTKSWIRKKGVKVLYIDLIGKIGVYDAGKRFGTREQEVSYISNELKNLASDMQIPVVLLSQLSRKVEERGDKRAILSDLRESGAIEQDADVVIFPYRPGYYGIEADEVGNAYPHNVTLLELAKYRDGKADAAARWVFEPQFSNFYDYSEFPFNRQEEDCPI